MSLNITEGGGRSAAGEVRARRELGRAGEPGRVRGAVFSGRHGILADALLPWCVRREGGEGRAGEDGRPSAGRASCSAEWGGAGGEQVCPADADLGCGGVGRHRGSAGPCRGVCGQRASSENCAGAGVLGRCEGSGISGGSGGRCAAAPPPRTCPTRRLPASRRPSSIFRAKLPCCRPAGVARRRCSPTGPSPTASSMVLTTWRWPFRSGCSAWCAPTWPALG